MQRATRELWRDMVKAEAAPAQGAPREPKRIRVSVLFFARARELLDGLQREPWDIQEGWTTSDLQVAVLRKHPALEGLFRVCAWALNEEYTDGPVSLHDGDELALIPPISGG